MQKLVTIQVVMNIAEHGKIEEYLATDLQAGWRIVSVTGAGGGGAGYGVGWFAVVLERTET